MNYKLTIMLSMIFLIGCGRVKYSNEEVASTYFKARNSMDFTVIKDLISDSLTVVEGDYIMPYSKESFYEVFRWDSVFHTEYDIVEILEEDEQIIASIGLSSIRNQFLKNDNMTCQYILSFTSGKISKIESLDCENVNWEIWQKRVKSLVDWVDSNHPELNGFIHDMTMIGAKNYVKAIHLYEQKESD